MSQGEKIEAGRSVGTMGDETGLEPRVFYCRAGSAVEFGVQL